MAHELLHSQRPLDKALSNLLLCSVGYMHWTYSHLAHHRNVCSQHPSHIHLLAVLHCVVPAICSTSYPTMVVIKHIFAELQPFLSLPPRHDTTIQ